MWLSVVAIILLASLAYYLAFALIEDMKELFLKAGMFGKDLNKKDDSKIPEGLGVVSAAVFLIVMFLFIPFPFLDNLINPANTQYIQFVQYLCAALLSVCCMTFLGFADDVLNLRWRHKLLLPTLASLPLLMIHFVSGGSTTVILPTIVRPLLGRTLYLGPLYYVYMSMLAVFCTNSINILAGINGVEVGQSLVIAASVTLYVTIELVKGICCQQQYLLSLCILLPFLGVASALYKHNRYPSKVFVGDTFCYFAGVVLAVSGILGLFSKTLLLFFIPQVLNFVYSTPQLFKLIPCPRHRLPRFNHNTGLLEMSRTTFVVTDLPPLGQTVFKLLKLFRLIDVKQEEGAEEMVSINNLTIINFVLKLRGPTHERTLTNYILLIQVFGGVVAFTIRYGLSAIFYLPPV